MESEFSTDDIRNVFSKIMQFMDSSESEKEEPNESPPPPVQKLPEKAQKSPIKSTPKPIVQQSNKKVTVGAFQKTTYARMQARQQAAHEKVKINAQLLEEKLQQNVKPKPKINKTMQQVQHIPISERYEDILKEKQRKISAMSEKLKTERDKEIEKELTFQPSLIKPLEKADYGNLIDRMKEWEEKLKEVLTFKPTICENSLKITSELGHKDVVLRLLERKKTEIEPEHYTFTPEICQKSTKLARTRSDTSAFARLFQVSKETLEEQAASSDKD